MVPAKHFFACIAFALTACGTATAQDTRHVVEPHYPSACTVLRARLSAPDGQLALADERKLDTARIQSAIDHCTAGKAVRLHADGAWNVFLSGPFQLKAGVTLLVDASTALFASRDPRDYDVTPGSCGVLAEKGHGCKPLITAEDAPNSGIMGEGAIDGRGGAEMLGQKITWWDLAHQAKVLDKQQNNMRLLRVDRSDNFALYKITLRNSPNSHVDTFHTDGFTAWGVKILTPKTARNTDGIDPQAGTKNVTIAYSTIHTGDDDVSIKSDVSGAASNMSILHNHFYTGHGMSIGSQTAGGVDHVLVRDLTIDGADNGLRIKSDRSRGGLVQNVTFEDVCLRNSPNPLVFTPMYTTFAGDKLPVFRDIALRNVHILTPGAFTFYGLDAQHKLGITLDNVQADGLQKSEVLAKNADIAIAGKRGNLVPAGDGVVVSGADAAEGTPISCKDRFLPLPAGSSAPQAAVKVLPEDKTFYVAADGTGDYYSIQRAIDVAPASGGALIMVAPGTYREVLNIDKPDIQLRSANPDASKTVVVFDRDAAHRNRKCFGRQFLRRKHHLSKRLQDHARSEHNRLAGRGAQGDGRPGNLSKRALAGASGHSLRGQQGLHRNRRSPRLQACAAVLCRELHRGPLRLHLRGWRDGLRSLRDSQQAVSRSADRWVHYGAEQGLPAAGLRLRDLQIALDCEPRREQRMARQAVATLLHGHLHRH